MNCYISEIVIQNSLLSQTRSEQNCWFNERSLLVITFLWFSCHFILPLYAHNCRSVYNAESTLHVY